MKNSNDYYIRAEHRQSGQVAYIYVICNHIDTFFELAYLLQDWMIEKSDRWEFWKIVETHQRWNNSTISAITKDRTLKIVNQIMIQNVYPQKINCEKYWTDRKDILQLFK